MRYVAVPMEQQLTLLPLSPEIERLHLERANLRRARLAKRTEDSYSYHARIFSAWCARMQLSALPASAETLSLYVTDLLARGKRVTTVQAYVAGVAHLHRIHNRPSPLTEDVRDTIWAAQRLRAEEPRQMHPLTVIELHRVAAQLMTENTVTAYRNRALLVIGFASGLRRSTLAALDLGDVSRCPEGLKIKIRREKQDRKARGRLVGLPFGKDPLTCPVTALESWLRHREIEPGPLFTRLDPEAGALPKRLSANAIYEIVKSSLRKAGISPVQRGPHSLRAGIITEAGQAGVNHLVIQKHLGYRSLDSLQRYFRPIDVFKVNPCSALDL